MKAVVDTALVGLPPTFGRDVVGAVRNEIARAAWTFFAENADEVVIARRVLFVKVEVRVRDLRPVFVRLFGAEPQRV